MIDQQFLAYSYVSRVGTLSLRSLFPMSTLSELMSGLERGVMSFEDTVSRVSAIMRDQELGTTLRVHTVTHSYYFTDYSTDNSECTLYGDARKIPDQTWE